MNIIITGASRGIGYETAKLLSAEHNVIAIARSSDKLEQLKKEGNSKNIFPIVFDFDNGDIKKELLPEIISSLSSEIAPSPLERVGVRRGEVVFTIRADRFLRGMVRIIVGTMMLVGKHKITLSDFQKIINSKDCQNAGVSVLACGLYLTKVEYPKKTFTPTLKGEKKQKPNNSL